MHTVIKVRWVIIKDEKIFLLRMKDSFMFPWGKQESWETVLDTFYREMLEETGVHAELGKFIWLREYLNQKGQITLQFLFEVKNTADFEQISKASCSHGHEWESCGFYSLADLETLEARFPPEIKELLDRAKYQDSFLSDEVQ